MPDTYVVTFFLTDLPLFWNVDIEVGGVPHYPELNRLTVQRDPVAGCLKVWVLDAKYLLRNAEGAREQVRQYYGRVFGTPPPPEIRPEHLMKTILDEVFRRADGT